MRALAPTPADVLFDKPCEEFLCSLSANTYHLDFIEFVVKDAETQNVFFQVTAPPDSHGSTAPVDVPPELEDSVRSVDYCFPAAILTCATISTGLVFSVGPKPVPSLRMIERHFFQGKLVRTYDMEFGFCIPNSTNSWEAQYDMPLYSPDQVQEYVAHPGEHQSDSFYFVGNDLIMHNKATYSYYVDESADDCED